jgi:hypothetical protein
MRTTQKKFTEEQIEKVNHINIISYAQSKGYSLERISKSSYKIPGYGGLFINSDGSKWNWFSKDVGGGTIQFVMEMEGKSWVDAVKELLGITQDELPLISMVKEDKHRGEMRLPEKNDTYKHLFAYLIKSRRIDQDIVTEFVDRKLIYEDKYRNCVFVGYNNNQEPAYASLRSTRTIGDSFRGDVRNSDKSIPFHYPGSGSTVCVFEASIDLMSYLSLLRIHGIEEFNHALISLGGVSDKGLQSFLNQHNDIDTIMLCLDNDQAGHDACSKINERYGSKYKMLRHKPKNKDFNEDLINAAEEDRTLVARESLEDYINSEADAEIS